MNGGTLLLSRYVNLHSYYKKRLEELGFKDVTVSNAEKDALNSLVSEMRPSLVMVGFTFYDCCTPFMVGLLKKKFPDLNVSAVSVAPYPSELAMFFLANGCKSCVYYHDGREQFYRGIDCVRDGKVFISNSIQERLEMRREMPMPAEDLTRRHIEVIRLLCNGFTTLEIGGVLHISERTVNNHKADIYTALNVRNENELIRVAIYLDLINPKELVFYGGDYVLKPKPDKQTADMPQIRRVK
jgi:DNA-binding NarL/FixJ family response regulator